MTHSPCRQALDLLDQAYIAVQALFLNSSRDDRGLSRIHVRQPNEEDGKILFYLQLIRQLVRPTRKILNFGSSQLPGYLLGIDLKEAAAAGPEDYPAITALGLALAPCAAWRPGRGKQAMKAEMDFDPFNPFPAQRRRQEGPEVVTEFDIFNF